MKPGTHHLNWLSGNSTPIDYNQQHFTNWDTILLQSVLVFWNNSPGRLQYFYLTFMSLLSHRKRYPFIKHRITKPAIYKSTILDLQEPGCFNSPKGHNSICRSSNLLEAGAYHYITVTQKQLEFFDTIGVVNIISILRIVLIF